MHSRKKPTPQKGAGTQSLPEGSERSQLSVTRALAAVVLHPLFDAIDAGVELIQPLAIILGLTRSGLRLCQSLFRRAVGSLQSGVERIDPLVHGGDLFTHEPFCRAARQTQRADKNHENRGYFH